MVPQREGKVGGNMRRANTESLGVFISYTGLRLINELSSQERGAA